MMTFLKLAHSAILAAGLLATTQSMAMTGADMPEAGDNLVVQVRGCHADIRFQYVPQFGEKAWHYHRQGNCRPVRAKPVARDCHRDIQRHFVAEYGRKVTHKHVGPNCRIRVYGAYNPNKPRPGVCVQIGPVRYCEY